jgi:hypothetical protein
MKKKRRTGMTVDMYLVHRQAKAKGLTQAVAPGVRALAWEDFLGELHPNIG